MNPQPITFNNNVFWKVFITGSLMIATKIGLLLFILSAIRFFK